MTSLVCAVFASDPFWLDVAKLALPSLVVIAGWYVVSIQQNRRERRKEIRELISVVKTNVDAMVADSVAYFNEVDDQKAQILAGRMKYESIVISKTLLLLSTAGLVLDCNEEMTQFRNAAMGEFFETKGRKKQLENPHFAQELALDAGTLLDAVESAYFTSFKIVMAGWRTRWGSNARAAGRWLRNTQEGFGGRGYRQG